MHKVTNLKDSIYVEVLTSPNCVHSPRAMKIARGLARKRKNMVLMEVSIATEQGMERAKEFDAKATPAIAVNGRLVYVGVPSPEDFESIVAREAANEKERTSYYF